MIMSFGNVLHVFGEQDVVIQWLVFHELLQRDVHLSFGQNVDPSGHALSIDARAATFQFA